MMDRIVALTEGIDLAGSTVAERGCTPVSGC